MARGGSTIGKEPRREEQRDRDGDGNGGGRMPAEGEGRAEREKDRRTERRRADRIERVAGQNERRRRQVYSGDLDANERFEALFDIRHDFIKHSSNVQTLYIELYSRSLGRLSLSLLSPWRIGPAPRGRPPHGVCLALSLSLFLRCPRPTVCCPRGGTAYNENIVPEELVMPQYRIMYNYITVGGGRAKERRKKRRGGQEK